MDIFRFIVIGIALLIISPATATTGYISEHLAQAQFTTRVKDRMPVDEVTKLSNEFKKVFFFTDVRKCTGCKIQHQWWNKGKMVSKVDGKSKSDRYRWWTSKTLTNNMTGQWTVKVLINGKVEFTETFTYYTPSLPQRQQAPIQKRLLVEEADGCETELRYFSEKLRENPDDAYFQFMDKKLRKRCLGE